MSSSDPADPHAAQLASGHANPGRVLRSQVNDSLHSEEALSAFLLDEFPEVHRELSAGMNRTQRVNELIERVEPQKIQAALNRTLAVRSQRAFVPSWQKFFLAEHLGSAVHQVAFGGRASELHQLQDWLQSDGRPYALVTGALGMGKSALAARFHAAISAAQNGWAVATVPLGAHSRIQRAEEILLALGRVLGSVHGREFTAESSRFLLGERLADLFALPLPEGKQHLVILDALDEVAEEICTALRLPPELPPGLRVLLTARSGRREIAPEALLEQLGVEKKSLALHIVLGPLSPAGVSEAIALTPPPQGGWPPHLASELYRVTAGDPLLLQLYLRELVRDEPISTLARLSAVPPGLDAYFERIWAEQQRVWAGQANRFSRLAQEVLALLSCALGPLPVADLPQLLPTELDRRGFALEEALRPLGRWLRGDRQNDELMLAHPRLADFFHTRFVLPNEKKEYLNRILDYGRRTLAALGESAEPTPQVSPYLVRHLGEHLARAGAPLRQLLALVSTGWRRACVACHGHDGEFLLDLERVSKVAQAEDQREIAAGRPAKNLGTRLRCLFFAASAASLAQGIPPELLIALVERAGWTIEHAASHARLIADFSLRVRALSSLTQRAQGDQALSLWRETLAAAESIESRSARADTLAELLSKVPFELHALRDEILARELNLPIYPAEGAASVVAAYLPFLPAETRQQAARVAADEVHSLLTPESKAHMLAKLAGMVEPPLRDQLIAAADELAKRLYPYVALSLIQYLPERQGEPQVRLGISHAQQISVPLWRAMALSDLALAGWIPPSERPKLARMALTALSEHLRAPDEPSRHQANPWTDVPGMSWLRDILKNVGRTVNEVVIGTDVERLAWNLAMALPVDALPELTRALAGHQWARNSIGLRIRAITLARQGSSECEQMLTELSKFDEETRYSCLISLSPVLPVHRLTEALSLCRAIEDEADCLRFLTARISQGFSLERLTRLTEQIQSSAPTAQAALFAGLLQALPAEARAAVEPLAIGALDELAMPQPRLAAILRLVPLAGCARGTLLTEALSLTRSIPAAQAESRLAALADLIPLCPASQSSELVDELIACLPRLTGEWQHRPVYYKWVQYTSAAQRAYLLQEAARTQSPAGLGELLASLLPHMTEPERARSSEQALKLCEKDVLVDCAFHFSDVLHTFPKRLLSRVRGVALRMCQDRSGNALDVMGRAWLLKLVELCTDPAQKLKSARELIRICQRSHRAESSTLIELIPHLPIGSAEQRALIARVMEEFQKPPAIFDMPRLADMNKLAPFLSEEQIRDAFAAFREQQRAAPPGLFGVQGLLAKLPADLLPSAGDFAITCLRRAVGEDLFIGFSKRVTELSADAQSALVNQLLAACATSSRSELLHVLTDSWPILEALGPPELAGQVVDALLDAQAAFVDWVAPGK